MERNCLVAKILVCIFATKFNLCGYDRLRIHFKTGEVLPLQGMGIGRIEKVCGFAAQTFKAGANIALLQQMGEGG